MTRSGTGATRGWWLELGIVAGFALLSALASGLWNDIGTRMYGGGLSDPAQDAWVLSRLTHQMLHDPLHLFEGNIFYPAHHSILFCDPLLGPAVLVLPIRLFSANPVLLYNSAVLLSLISAAWGFYRLARHLHNDRGAALLAGIAIPFCSQQMVRLWHLNLLSIGFFPFLILGLLRLLERPGPVMALLTGAAFALQAGTSGYHAFSAAFFAILVVLWHWRRLRDPRVWLWLAVALGIAAVALFPYLRGFAYLQRHEAPMVRTVVAQEHYSLDLPVHLLGSRSILWQPLLGNVGRKFFPGLTVIVFAALALRQPGRRDVRFWAGVTLFFLLIAAGPQIRVFGQAIAPGPFALFARWLPFFGAVRHPLTFAVPALMALGVLASLGLHTSGASRSRGRLACVLLAAVAETVTHPPSRRAPPAELPAVYDYLRTQPAGALLEVPLNERRWMWWSIRHGMPIVNGGGAFRPSRYTGLRLMIRSQWKLGGAAQTAHSVEFLRTWFPVRYVILHSGAPPGYRQTLSAHADAFQLLHQTAEGDRVYRLRRGGRGRALKRAFRDDQLRTGTLTVTLRGSRGLELRASLNGTLLARQTLSGAEETAAWHFPAALVRGGLNMLHIRLAGGAAGPQAPVEFLDVEADPPDSSLGRS